MQNILIDNFCFILSYPYSLEKLLTYQDNIPDRKIKVKLTNHQACHFPKNQSMYIALVCTSVWAYRTNIIIVDVVYTDLKIIRDHLASFLVNQYHTHFRRSLFLIDLAKKGSKLNQFSIKRHFQNLISKCSGTFINSYFKM